jgi:hypothetical protein
MLTDGVHGQVAAPLAGGGQAQRRLVLLVHERRRQHDVAPRRRLRAAKHGAWESTPHSGEAQYVPFPKLQIRNTTWPPAAATALPSPEPGEDHTIFWGWSRQRICWQVNAVNTRWLCTFLSTNGMPHAAASCPFGHK